MVIARPAARGSTGVLQDKPLSHPARRASQASTNLQEALLIARPVPRTRTRLLRAVLEPSALAMQATVATPAQEHAQRA